MILWTRIALAACITMAAFAPAACCQSRAEGAVSISIDNPGDGAVVDSELNISGMAAGPAGVAISVSVSIDGGQSYPALGNTSWIYRWSPDGPGQHTILATATAGNDWAAAQVTVFYVPPDFNASIIGHEPASTELSVMLGQSIMFGVNITGPIVSTLVRWFVNGSDLGGQGSNLGANITFSQGPGETIPVEARLYLNGTVVDSVIWNVTVTRPQGPPEITAFRPSNFNVTVAIQETVKFNVTSSDPDGDRLNITWFVDGEPRPPGAGKDSFEIYFNESGDHIISVSVSDGAATVNVTWNLTVAPDYVPGLLDTFPVVVYMMAGLAAGLLYGRRNGRMAGQRPL